MLWENERWIKLYVRSSPEFLSLSWQARGLFRLILTELDPAGRMVLGKVGLRAVAVAVRASWGEIESPLLELLDDGCLVLSPDQRTLVAKSYLEAQSAAQSTAARQRNKRARDAALAAVTESDNPVTESDSGVTQSDKTVTASHAASRAVTGCHAPLKRDQREETDQRDQIPSLTLPSREGGSEAPVWNPVPVLESLRDMGATDSSGPLHDAAIRTLSALGFACEREHPVASRGDSRPGRIDVFASRGEERIAIELDRLTPREKSLVKLSQVDAVRVVVLREAEKAIYQRDGVWIVGVSSQPRPRTVKTVLPPEWAPSAAHVSMAASEGGKGREWVDREAQAMRDWATANARRYADWDAMFRGWIRKALSAPQRGYTRQQLTIQPVARDDNGESYADRAVRLALEARAARESKEAAE